MVKSLWLTDNTDNILWYKIKIKYNIVLYMDIYKNYII